MLSSCCLSPQCYTVLYVELYTVICGVLYMGYKLYIDRGITSWVSSFVYGKEVRRRIFSVLVTVFQSL